LKCRISTWIMRGGRREKEEEVRNGDGREKEKYI
jgi:hypothetical protein